MESQNTRLRELIVVNDFQDRDKHPYKKGEVYWQIQTPIGGNRNWNFLYIEGKDGNPLMVKVKNIDYVNK